ncbi:MAG TPA: hypothetical protein VHE35_30650 [Kofleriaceae bacterium]|nr:hypothetical protein [Kofleriaceae bacterium]
MRIACVHLPSFPLQAALLAAPGGATLDGEGPSRPLGPIAVVSHMAGHLGGPVAIGAPVVLACSRAAWAQGIRPQMTAATARALVPGLTCMVADVAGERRLLCAVADSLLAVAARVDVGGDVRGQHHALYLEVPVGKRGGWFGGRVLELLAVHGLRGRIGIADDRFTAYVAASAVAAPGGDEVVCVPRGGSASFLAPHPLSLLSLAPEVQHMLEALGVKTLGAFAELPPPSVAHAWDADFQALARGDGGARFTAYRPGGPIAERVVLEAEGVAGSAVAALARRLARRLVGRGRAADDAVEVKVQLHGAGELARTAIVHALPREEDLADAIGRVVGDEPWRTIEAVTGDAITAIEPAPVLAPAASSEAQAAVAPLTLAPPPSVLGDRVEHRRTRRGKHRPRIASAQARLLFGEP